MTRLSICLLAAVLLSQQPPHAFELTLPDFFEKSFDGGNVIELPPRAIRRLNIQILEAAAHDVREGQTFVKINGKGATNVFDQAPGFLGSILKMNPGTLDRRPDPLFDPRENMIEVSASDSRGKRFYQNWILRTHEQGRNELFAYTSSVSPSDPAGAPPDLIVELPATPPVIPIGRQSIAVRLKGVVAAPDPGITLSLNGNPLTLAPGGPMNGFDTSLPVARGVHNLMLEAADRKGNKRGVMIPIVTQERAPVRTRFAGSRYAIVIGISRFAGSPDRKGSLPLLPGAAAEATLFGEELVKRGEFLKSNVLLLTDEHATGEQIRSALSSFAARPQADDLLVVYLASHGLHDPAHPDQIYLAAYDSNLASIQATGVQFSELRSLLDRNVHCNNSFLIFDVGHQPGPQWRLASRNLVNPYLLTLFSEQAGRAVLVSGSADQVSLPMSAPTSSGASTAFAYWLIDGLAGKADLNLDRVVTAEELFRFVSEKVKTETSGAEIPRYALGSRAAQTQLSAVTAP